MLSASLYIIVCSGRNRLVARLRRLREPRYLLGALAGAAYFYFAVFMRFRGVRGAPRRDRGSILPPGVLQMQTAASAIAGVSMLAAALLAWLLPTDSGLLVFSQAETNLLVPAPLTRRQLLVHRLLRSQLPLLFAALMSAVFIPLAFGARLRFGAGLFLMFVAMRVYFAGVSMARARLGAANATVRNAAWAPLVLLLCALAVVGGALLRVYLSSPPGLADLFSNGLRAIERGLPAVVLWPFTAVVWPLFADSYREFAWRLPGALAVLALLVVWVLRSDQVFQASADEGAQAPAEPRRRGRAPVARDIGWRLGLSGRSEMLFMWKNAMQTLRGTNLASVLPFLVPIIVLSVVGATARWSSTSTRGPAAALAMASLMVAGFFALLGPQAMRSDLRGDLRHLDVLKTWPVAAAAVIRGELLWPTVWLTICAWFALASAMIFSAAAFPRAPLGTRVSLAVALLLLTPAVVGAQVTVHNAAAVMFPAWVPIGPQRPRGLEAMGQRLILFAGVVLALVVMLGPGAIAGALITFGLFRFIGPASFGPAAAVCLAITVVEIALVTEMLGSSYARIDLSQVERGE